MRVRKVISTVLVIFWMGLIFSFSARDAEVSTQMSTSVGELICSFFVPGYEEYTEERQYELAAAIDYPVRKTAHAMEYAVLGVLFSFFYTSVIPEKGQKKKSRFMLPVLSFFSGAVYAASDEFHQLFVPGRSGQVSDVLLDSAGVLAGVLFMFWILWLIRKRQRLRQELVKRGTGK